MKISYTSKTSNKNAKNSCQNLFQLKCFNIILHSYLRRIVSVNANDYFRMLVSVNNSDIILVSSPKKI